MFISVSVLGPTGEKHPVSYFQNSGFSLERRQKRLLSKEENCNHLGASKVVSRRPKCCLSLTNIEEVVEM